jgi:signal transduction histidine kinase
MVERRGGRAEGSQVRDRPLTAIDARADGAVALDASRPPGIEGAGARRRAVAIFVVGCAAVMSGTAFWFGITSEHVPHPVATAVYSAYLVAAFLLMGLYWWLRRPASRFGTLLMAFGAIAWVYSWESADAAVLFDLGVRVEGPLAFLTFYLFLAFPSGRVTGMVERLLLGALGLSLLVFFGLWVLMTPALVGGGPLAGCVAACPANVLQVGSVSPEVVLRVGEAETYVGLVATVGVVVVYALRLGSASRPQRRALIAVAATPLLFMPVFFVYHFARQALGVEPARLETLGWVLIGCRVLLPLGFLVALWQAELFAARALRAFMDRLAARPTPAQWRHGVATALDDAALEIGYWDALAHEHRQADGRVLEPPPRGSGRAWVQADRDGQPVAAMVVDVALAEDPEIVRAAASATVLAVENGALEGEAKTSRAWILEAGHAERRRIERDLHDSAQQRLVALGIRLSLAGERLDGSEHRALVDDLGAQVDEALRELRGVAGGAPRTLIDEGIAAAIRAVAAWTPLEITVLDHGGGRHADGLESTVYYCRLEALQNAAKHAGPDATVVVRLREDDRDLVFEVQDDGQGFDVRSVERRAGLANIAERVEAVGGRASIDSSPGEGTRIVGRLPL